MLQLLTVSHLYHKKILNKQGFHIKKFNRFIKLKRKNPDQYTFAWTGKSGSGYEEMQASYGSVSKGKFLSINILWGQMFSIHGVEM